MDKNQALTTVKNFLETWEDHSTLKQGYADFMAEDIVWENTGLSPVHGRSNALDLVDKSIGTWGRYKVEGVCKNIFADGNIVFVERVDLMKQENGEVFCEVPIAGVFEVNDDGKIASWKDYYDPKNMLKSMSEFIKRNETEREPSE